MPGRSCFFKDAKLPLGDERATAATVSNQIDDEDSPALEFGKLKSPFDSAHGCGVNIESAFPCGRESVQGECGVDGFEVAAVVVESVDPVDLDEQLLDVLGGNFERNKVLRSVEGFVLGQEIDVDAILKPLNGRSSQNGKPLFGVTNAIDQLGFCQKGFEIAVREVVNKAVDVLIFPEKVQEVVFDQGLFIIKRWHLNAILEVLPLLNITGILLANESVAEFWLKVVSGAGKVEVFEEERAVVVPCLLFHFEDFVENRCLEGVVSWGKSTNKLEQAIEVFFLFFWVVADVDVIRRSQTF